MKKVKFNATWLLMGAVPFQIAAIILFGAGKSVLGGVLLAIGSILYVVGILLSRKERKAEQAAETQVLESAEATEEKAEATEGEEQA